jgi:hypothetical protein
VPTIAFALAALIAVGLAAVVIWWVSRGSPSTTADAGVTTSPTSSQTSAEPSPAPSGTEPSGSESPAAGADVTTTRSVTVAGEVVTVTERSTVAGGRAVAAASRQTPPGLRLVSISTVTKDDGVITLVDRVAVTSSEPLTIRGRYRLTSCPDLLPAAWPSPVDFVAGTQTYERVQEPLHTAYALCPDADSRARPLPGLTATVTDEAAIGVPQVRLRWQGAQALTIAAIGSVSGVAALPVELDCGGDCVAALSPGASATVLLQPVDPCPPRTDNDTLTLLLDGGSVVRVDVAGLHREVCG